MSLQIRKVVLYHESGDYRELNLRVGRLNIITGASKTGKSSILDIVDYCMGRSDCNIADGIQRVVSWFAVLLQHDMGELFIARRSPGGLKKSSPDVYLQQWYDGKGPWHVDLVANVDVEGLIAVLSRATGIRENQQVTRPGSTRVPFRATIRHSLFYCFQDQNDIDNRRYLFHRQSETFVAVDLRHTLPYFLGAIDERRLFDVADLARLEARIQALTSEIHQGGGKGDLAQARMLLTLASSVGLLDAVDLAEDYPGAITQLRQAVGEAQQDGISSIGDVEKSIVELRERRVILRNELADVRERLRELQDYERLRDGYTLEIGEQESRLAVIRLFDDEVISGANCPICHSELGHHDPSLAEMAAVLSEVRFRLRAVGLEAPDATRSLLALRSNEQQIVLAMRSNQRNLLEVLDLQRSSEETIDEAIIQSRVSGRVEQFLEDHDAFVSDNSSQQELDTLSVEAAKLRKSLASDLVEERMDTFLGFVNADLTEYAKALSLEYSDTRVRLDARRLTIIADTVDGPVSMDRMGSGENWVGYHIASHLALHKWLRQRNRPVPGFIILDQPSQAHFPSEDPNIVNLSARPSDQDTAAVTRMYELIHDVTVALAPELQVIVTDHARIDQPWFTESIVEEWRQSTQNALLPQAWLEQT